MNLETLDKPRKTKVDPPLPEFKSIDKAVIGKQFGLKRTTEDLFSMAESMGVDPFAILLNIADGNKLALDLDDEGDKPISPELRAMAARECIKFMYPTMKASEISGPGGSALPPQVVRILFEEGKESYAKRGAAE
jgi:hypothetical protein